MMRQDAAARAGGIVPRRCPDRPAVPDLAAIENEVLRRWAAANVFARSLAQAAGRPLWICHESPQAASGMPGAQHVPGRAIRDLYQRFKAMQGFQVPRRGGWDCHGLLVEVAVERELGLSGRPDIEAYGVDRFAARCRESALRHVEAFSALITRMGHWVDLEHAYRTMDADYIESVWWSLRQIFDAGLLVRDHRVVPYCPRCQTPLSDPELGQPDPRTRITSTAVTVRFPLNSLPDCASHWLRGADLLVRTVTPWALVPTTGIAVHPHQTYAVARRAGHDDRVVVADTLVARTLGEGWHVVARVTGAELAGATYRPAFSLTPITEAAGAHRVVSGYFVPTRGGTSGTGLIHLAPGYGTDDMRAALAYGLPVVSPIGPDGRFDRELPLVGGMFFADASPVLIQALADRGRLFAARRHEHGYPHCWRCGTPLLRRAVPAWYIRTTALRDRLFAESERTKWVPATVKDGRPGDWLGGHTDWALSRTRYWGTPLPLWECQHGHVTCAASLAELAELAGRDLTGVDPHRPSIDLVTITCPRCGGIGHRVPEVIDARYDAGAMPFAQYGAHPDGLVEGANDQMAQLVAESADEGKGWLSALMTIGALVSGRTAFQTALCLASVQDAGGHPMTRSLGNLAEPLPLIERHGADALRWFCAAAKPPPAAIIVSDAALHEVVRKVLLRYWNTVSFLVVHTRAATAHGGSWWPADRQAPPPARRSLLDRWIISELHRLVSDVTTDLESFQPATAGRRIAAFIDDLSNWYLRRSRSRFRRGRGTADGAAAFATLHDCLEALTRVMAPTVPFITDYAWNLIRGSDAPDSVHLASWPVPVPTLIDDQLAGQMALARRLAELGRSARAAAMIKVRQPLASAVIAADGFADLSEELRALVADELNVRSLEPLTPADDEHARLGPDLRARGRRLGLGEAAIGAGQPAGWAVAVRGDLTVALDVVITPALHRAGLAREVTRLIQDARKAGGLDVGDPIALRWSAAGADLAISLAEHGPTISADVLAVDYGAAKTAGCLGPGTSEHVSPELGLTFWLRPLGG